MSRVYCWRTGGVFEVEEGKPCPECSLRDHPTVDGETCGEFVRCPSLPQVHNVFNVYCYDGSDGHGHACELPAGHAGEHETTSCEGAT